MTPEEATFILEKDPATGASLAYTALRHNQPMWRVLFEAGLPQAIRSNTGARRDLLEKLLFVPEKENAKVVLEGFLDDMKKPQIQKLLCNERGGEVLVSTWMRNCTEYESVGPQKSEARFVGSKKGLDTLLGCFASRGLDINPQFKGKGKYNASYDASPLREAMSKFLHENMYPLKEYAVPAAKALFDHGAKLDDATRKMVMGTPWQNKAIELIVGFKEAGLAQPQEWLLSPSKDDKPENIALVQAMMAKDQIAAIHARAKTSPRAN